MALSKFAILLIAGIGSVAAIGGITAGIVVSRQNSVQSNESTDEFIDPNATNNKENKNPSSSSSNAIRTDSRMSDSMVGNDHSVDKTQNDAGKIKEEHLKEKESKGKKDSDRAEENKRKEKTEGIKHNPAEPTSNMGIGSKENEEQNGKNPGSSNDLQTDQSQKGSTTTVKEHEEQPTKEGNGTAISDDSVPSQPVVVQSAPKTPMPETEEKMDSVEGEEMEATTS